MEEDELCTEDSAVPVAVAESTSIKEEVKDENTDTDDPPLGTVFSGNLYLISWIIFVFNSVL